MNRSRYFLLGAAILFLLLAMASCNWPGSTPDETDTPEGGGAATEPVDVTTVPAPPPANTDGAEVILIPGATFWMGSDPVDAQADADEFPRHQVALSGFYIYTHEVTNAMYAECVAAGACLPIRELEAGPTSHYADPAYAEHPVAGADWNMAHDYCAWAGGRLPTEAEWELASRGAESLRYPWGDADPACDRANMLGCTNPPDTLAVGSLANGNSPYEVWDMSGNVWEWVNDWYDEDYFQLSPSSNPLGPYYGELKAVRGGGLYSETVQMRSAARVGANPQRGFDDVGFRCVPEAEALPLDYYLPDERHEWTDPGGEHVEDPDDDIPWYSLGSSWATCPSEDGLMELLIEADSSEEVEYAVVVNGNPFDCYYDELFRGLQCIGPVPTDNDTLEYYTVEVHYDTGDVVNTYPRRRLDCEGTIPMWDAHARASCPADGWVTVTFESNPPVPWDVTQLEVGGAYVDMPCWPVGGGRTNCLVPARAPGDDYRFYLRGPGPDGWTYNWYAGAVIPSDCPGGDVTVTSGCGEDGPVVQVMYEPSAVHLASVSVGGVPLFCIGMAPGVQVCGPLPGEAGSPATVTTCFEGEACVDWPLTVAVCPGETVPGHFIDIVCYPPGATAVSIRYWPFDSPLVSVDAGGADLTCEDRGGGAYLCPGLTFAPGGGTTVTACLADGSCFSETDTIPSCSEEEPSGSWALLDVGCHSETQIYVLFDTPFSGLVPGVPYTYAVTDFESAYACDLHPTIPGRLYCSGLRPSAASTLSACISVDGGPDTCTGFTDFAARIPVCVADQPDQPVAPCSSYTNPFSCNNNGCQWHLSVPSSPSSTGYCTNP